MACLVTVFENFFLFSKNKENKGNIYGSQFFCFEKHRTQKTLISENNNSFKGHRNGVLTKTIYRVQFQKQEPNIPLIGLSFFLASLVNTSTGLHMLIVQVNLLWGTQGLFRPHFLDII